MKNFEDMDNKEFAFACLDELKKAGKLNTATLATMTNPSVCHDLFHSSHFPVLLEVPNECSDEELRSLCHVGNKRRYYQNRITAEGRTFVVTKHWYGPGRSMPDNRTPFLEWVSALTKN